MRRALTLASPAKLNLVLRVVGKRKDGYHELVTLFHRISLRDTLRLQKRQADGIRLICSHPKVPKGETNLIVRAFRRLKKACLFMGGVTVRLSKQIPVGSGLGGGSSNAAHFLIGMNRLFRLGLSRRKLMKLGEELGADVPFFVSGARHALGRGKGERIEALSFRRKLWFVLIGDSQGLSTHKVYQGFRNPKERVSLTGLTREVKMISACLEKGRPGCTARRLINDLARSAEEIRPSLKRTREILEGLQLGICQMSGSGPALFILFSSQKKALRALRQIRRLQWAPSAVVCHSL